MPNKYAATFKDKNGEIFNVMDSEARSDISSMNAATAGDIGKVLSPKTVSSGKVIEWQYIDSALDWLEHNNLDAIVTGKVNMLTPPYTMDDVENGKIIYANGSINDAYNQSISPLIPISAGTYGLKVSHTQYVGNINNGNNYKNGYGFFAYDGTTIVARPSTLMHKIEEDIYVFDVPDGAAYVRFCWGSGGPVYYEDALECFNQWILLPDADDNIDASFFTLQQKKPNNEIDKLTRVDGSYATIRDTSARESAAEALARPITFGRKTCAIFEKVCCIGDSYTSGYIYSSSGTAISNNKYSWVEHIKNATGREYVNCGRSGATTKSWLSSPDGLAKAQLPENKAQAYIVALQINDAETNLEVGTIADIGTSAQTYCGCTSKIIDEIFNINNDAHIFFLTQPKHFTGIHTPYREAELAVIEWYQTAGNGTHQNQVHLIDLLDYWQLFHYPGCTDSAAGGHYTGVGWEYTAEIIMYAWSKYINEHPLLFQDVNLIPYGPSTNLNYVTPEMYGAKGDGVTDDSQAIQAACDAGYSVYFASNKIYYMASSVTINHNIKLFGGENTVIKTQSVTENETTTLNQAFSISGTLKKTTTLTTDYTTADSTANSGNQFTLADMTGINVGDLLVITATDQYYSYARQYYYLGAVLLVSSIYDGHLYTSCDMPWNIENTANVSVKVYDAPEITIENLDFVSDLARVGYAYFISMAMCKNSTVRNCHMKDMWNGMILYYCFNSHVDCVTVSTGKYDNSLSTDSYGICLESCTNSIIERVNSIAAQGCLEITGFIPSINTVIRNCNASGECRSIGIDMHENAYNTVIEDCTLGGLSLYGTCYVSRCRIIKNNRVGGEFGITLRGSHNPTWAIYKIKDCEMFAEGNRAFISITRTRPQDPVQNFQNVFGSVEIENMSGGYLMIMPTIADGITANIIKRLIVKNWRNCYEVYRTFENVIEHMEVVDCNFTAYKWLNNHSDSYAFDGIRYLHVRNDYPKVDKMYADTNDHGRFYDLPAGKKINLSSSDTSAHYVICGKNLASNKLNDVAIGSASGTAGGTLTLTVNSNFSNSLSVNANGDFVFTQPNSTSTCHIYPLYKFYVSDPSIIKVSCKLKNTGSTNGSAFGMYICIIDPETGLITYINRGDNVTATAQGATATHWYSCDGNRYVMCWIRNSTPVANAETTFEEYMASIVPRDCDEELVYEEYNGVNRDSNGSLLSLDGQNWIASSADSFSVNFKADLLSRSSNVSSVSNFQNMISDHYGS